MPKPRANSQEIRDYSRQLARELNLIHGACLDSGYTLSQCHVLYELSNKGPLNLAELAKILLIDKSNLSRTIKRLVGLKLVRSKQVPTDGRQKQFSLTAKGTGALRTLSNQANRQVRGALANLSGEQQETAVEGLKLYTSALRKHRLQSEFSFRRIKQSDNSQIAFVIRKVMTEFQAVGEGYSINDAEVDDMYHAYRSQRACYMVILNSENQIVGGGGIGPLQGGGKFTCELRKMFFLPEARGIGMGRRLLLHLLEQARQLGFRECYLETLERMEQASELYRRNGFKLLSRPRGKTGHCSCDRWYLLKL